MKRKKNAKMENVFIAGDTNYVLYGRTNTFVKFTPNNQPYYLTKEGKWEYSPWFLRLLHDSQYSFLVLNPNDFFEKDGVVTYIGNAKAEDVPDYATFSSKGNTHGL